MARLFNLARVSTATTGTGTVTLGSAISGFLTFALAGVSNGETVAYGISDGANSEVGTGVYTSSGTTLTRSVTRSTNSNNPISLSGTAQVYILARAEDILNPANNLSDVASAASALANLSGFGRVRVQQTQSSGTYTPSAGMLYCIIECVGGGGSGGAVFGNTGFSVAAGGGGSGGYSRYYASAADIGASKTITIGAGGAASAGNGNAGGDTSVGSLCIAKGGAGGQAANGFAVIPSAGAGGGTSGAAGSFTIPGTPGHPGCLNSTASLLIGGGNGGRSFYGPGGAGVVGSYNTAGAGNAGAYGGGGGGAYAQEANGVGANSGAGGTGFVVITEFCTQ